ncbi:hypothetical protein B0H11DRAFT_2230070 [Mycena galericulata]|nr:hypothetical protein B0H11DRAFT_2230070 [Mycena galericulata]
MGPNPDVTNLTNLDLKHYIRRAETHRKDGKAGTSTLVERYEPSPSASADSVSAFTSTKSQRKAKRTVAGEAAWWRAQREEPAAPDAAQAAALTYSYIAPPPSLTPGSSSSTVTPRTSTRERIRIRRVRRPGDSARGVGLGTCLCPFFSFCVLPAHLSSSSRPSLYAYLPPPLSPALLPPSVCSHSRSPLPLCIYPWLILAPALPP